MSKVSSRDTKRLQTKERLFDASVAEFKRNGMAAADIKEIVSAAGVAHGTFFFHFPTKEHVLLELEVREEERMAQELGRSFKKKRDLPATLNEIIRVVQALERRLGVNLFKDFLALHFSTTRPPHEEWQHHPFIIAVVEELERARERGELAADTDAFHSGVFFLLGLYALLITIPSTPALRKPVLQKYVETSLHGMCGHESSRPAPR
ncbi:TetR family transcriptional regulator [Nocardia sp. NPDC051750]|uniref:TetR family transcriptional regulator n=1 Tax=Nocardia sp. NPDC051750 TaxID=3364325 RepID=UPI0037BD1FC2